MNGSGNKQYQDPDALCMDPVRFQHYLDTVGEDFLLLSQHANQRSAHFRFTGPCQGRTVIWDCHLLALKPADENQHDFIEINEQPGLLIPLRVGLNIARIDIPAIRKMIIMIRQYKRLGPGRLEFGGR